MLRRLWWSMQNTHCQFKFESLTSSVHKNKNTVTIASLKHNTAKATNPYSQYLNCKILHGGTLLQPRPNFREDYVIPSPQLNEDQKKRSSRKIKVFFPRNQVKTKKKVFTAIWDYTRPEFVGFIRAGWLFRLIIQRTNLDGWTSKSRWWDAKSQWGDANSRWGMRPPYNLSTALAYWYSFQKLKFRIPNL